MKDIQIVMGKDGRLQGWEKGRWKYIGDSDNTDLHLVDDRTLMRVTNCSGKAITLHWDNFSTSISHGVTIDDIPISLRFLWASRLLDISTIIQKYWKDGVGIASAIASILSALRAFGILIYRS